MGRSQKLTADPAIAKSHEAGASGIVVQTLAHKRLGAISYRWPRQWVFHARAAQAAFEELTVLHRRLVEFPVHGPTAMRSILDMDYLEAVYRAGSQMAIEAILTLQHLCEEIERGVKAQLQEPTLDGRLRDALQKAGMTAPAQRAGHAMFVELETIRDAIEHPKMENVYNGQSGQWDRVPLAWFLSERGLAAFEGWDLFLGSIADDWEERQKQFAGPANLIVQRGIHSQLQFKKPPK
jgi:hypothetical protein